MIHEPQATSRTHKPSKPRVIPACPESGGEFPREFPSHSTYDQIMESPGYPKSWIPYMTTKDCSQGLCSLYCPHWCYVALPPPTFRFSDDNNSGPTFSPLVIAIIGILASIFLLVSYYTLISKCCGDTNSRRREISDPDAQLEENRPRSVQEPWQVAAGGLDEALIKSIAVCRYKKHNGGVVEGTCSVCLSEFQEDESIRLLPTCTHAFHVPCIDAWLKSHSNCPLCRSEVVFNPPSSSSPAPTPALATDRRSLGNESSTEIHQEESENDNSPAAHDSGSAQKMVPMSNGPTTPSRNFSDVGNPESTLTIIEVSDGSSQSQQVRRSLSMDHLCRTCVSAAATSLHSNGQERLFIEVDECEGNAEAGPAKQSLGEVPKTDVKRRLLHLHRVCGVSPAATLKRSFSSGRISFLSRHGRWKNATIPV